jgi:hypothetical protein
MSSTSPLTSGLRRFLGRAANGNALHSPRFEDHPSVANSSQLSTGWDEPLATRQSAQQFERLRLQLADEIARELIMRPDFSDAPEPVQRFLAQVWPLVLAHARLQGAEGGGDAAGLRAAVNDLLWSVKRDAVLRQPGKLFRILPGLVLRLRTGLSLLGELPRATDAFFGELEKLHQPVLRLCAVRRDEVRSAPAALEGEAPRARRPLVELEPGGWVDLYSRRQWLRARLEWVDPQRQQFMFVSRHGGLHTMPRRLVERLEREQLLRAAAGPG